MIPLPRPAAIVWAARAVDRPALFCNTEDDAAEAPGTAKERSPVAIKAWLEHDYLAIARTARRIAQSTMSAVSNRGLIRFMLYDGALNAARFIAFRRLIKDAGQKVVLIV